MTAGGTALVHHNPAAAGRLALALITQDDLHFVRLVLAGRRWVVSGYICVRKDVIRQQRPPVHFKQKDAIGLQCRMWSSPRLARALARTAEAAKAARLTSSLEEAITEELLIVLAGAARPAAGRGVN